MHTEKCGGLFLVICTVFTFKISYVLALACSLYNKLSHVISNVYESPECYFPFTDEFTIYLIVLFSISFSITIIALIILLSLPTDIPFHSIHFASHKKKKLPIPIYPFQKSHLYCFESVHFCNSLRIDSSSPLTVLSFLGPSLLHILNLNFILFYFFTF